VGVYTILVFLHTTTCMFTLHAGSHKHFGRRGPTHGVKDVDGSSIVSEGKHSRRGTGYNSHEVI
jgi:hypothetical protein